MTSEGILDKVELIAYLNYLITNTSQVQEDNEWSKGYRAGFEKIKWLVERGHFSIDNGVPRGVLLFFKEFASMKRAIEDLEEFKNRIEGNQ